MLSPRFAIRSPLGERALLSRVFVSFAPLSPFFEVKTLLSFSKCPQLSQIVVFQVCIVLNLADLARVLLFSGVPSQAQLIMLLIHSMSHTNSLCWVSPCAWGWPGRRPATCLCLLWWRINDSRSEFQNPSNLTKMHITGSIIVILHSKFHHTPPCCLNVRLKFPSHIFKNKTRGLS